MTSNSMTAIALGAVVLLAACSAPPDPPTPMRAPAPASQPAAATKATIVGDPVEGRRVATRVGCFGCHGKQLQGKELWGEPGKFQVRSANITEKRALYDDAAFERLLRTGKTHDGHRALGMPIQMYQHLSESEVRDIVALVRSLPTVANPKLKPSWFAPEERSKVEGWGDDRGDPVAAGAPAVPPAGGLARGKHLAMTSCPECHGAELNGFEGDSTPGLIVAKGYSLEQFRVLVRTGITAQGVESKSGLMTDVARGRLAPTLSDADIDALKAYLDSR